MLFKTGRKALAEHLTSIRSTVSVKNKTDAANIATLELELSELDVQHTTLNRWRALVFILLYASVVSTISAGLPVLGEIAQTIAYIGGFAGVGVLSILVLYLTWRINQVWQHMLIIYGHLIAIYEKHNKAIIAKE